MDIYADKQFKDGLSFDTACNFYPTEVGERAVRVIPPTTRKYRRRVSDLGMV